jgi:hypothetical protein
MRVLGCAPAATHFVYYQASLAGDFPAIKSAMPKPSRRFPPPWSTVEETDACFIVGGPFRGQTCSVSKPAALVA